MKRELMGVLALIAVGSFALSGCQSKPAATQPAPAAARAVVVAPSGQLVVPQPPPPQEHEVLPTPSTPASVWVQGYWAYMDWRWVWIPAHWERLQPAFVPPPVRPWQYQPRRWAGEETKG